MTVLTDTGATMHAVYNSIAHAVKTGCGLLLSISSHGTQIPDLSGDEADGYDEAFVMYDSTFDNLLTDDMLYDLFRQTEARVEVWLDTCHSGTGARVWPGGEKDLHARYLHNPNCDGLKPKHRTLLARAQRENHSVVLWSGCRADEVSWDARIGSRQNGVFSRSWLNNYAAYSRTCRRSIAGQVQRTLDRWSYDQHPQLEASFFRRYSGIKFL